MSERAGWGPSHQTKRKEPWNRRPAFGVAVFVSGFVVWSVVGSMVVALIVVAIAVSVIDVLVKASARPRPRGEAPKIDPGQDPLASVRQLAHTASGGAYLGVTKDGEWRFSRSERAVLVLGPPRSGKTSAVIVPSVIAHSGAVVCTSTKPDIAAATGRARRRSGRVWVFDPTGGGRPRGFELLRWSPIRCARVWDGALLMARAMTAGASVGTGTQNEGHWAKRSQALLGPMLHAAAIEGLDMEHVVGWVMRHELDEPGIRVCPRKCVWFVVIEPGGCVADRSETGAPEGRAALTGRARSRERTYHHEHHDEGPFVSQGRCQRLGAV